MSHPVSDIKLNDGEIVTNTFGGMLIEWEIEDFFAVNKDGKRNNYESPIFVFESVKWFIKLCNYMCGIRLYLCNYDFDVHYFSVEYIFGLKGHCSDVELIKRGYLKEDKICSYPIFFSQSEVLERNFNPEKSGSITVTCRLKSDHYKAIHPIFPDKPKLQKFMRLDTLSQNLKSLFDDKDNCDTSLVVQNKEFKAHRALLIARSSVFSEMFNHNTSEKQSSLVTIPDCDSDSFSDFLEFLYCGKLELVSTSKAFTLYETSDKYNVQELKIYLAEYLADHLTLENILDVVILAEKYGEKELFSAALDYFTENKNEIVDSSAWDSFVKNHYRLSKELLKQMKFKVSNPEDFSP